MATEIQGLDELTSAQSNKFVTYNANLRKNEAMTIRVKSKANGGPPASPVSGDAYIVDVATGAWASFTVGNIAQSIGGVWYQYTRAEGLRVWLMDTDKLNVYNGSIWKELTAASAGIDAFTGGSILFSAATSTGAVATIAQDNANLNFNDSTDTLTTKNFVTLSSGTFTANGPTVLNGSATTSSITASGAAIFGSTVVVSGSTTHNGAVINNGSTTASSITASGAISFTSTLSAGATTLASLVVTSATTHTGTMTNNGSTILNGSTTASAISASGPIILSNTLTVSGATTLNAGVTSSAITANGLITASSGVRFSNSGTTTSGTVTNSNLVFYEEGTFLPRIDGSTTPGTGTYSGTQYGRFVRVGKMVTCQMGLSWSAHTGTGNMRLENLPYAPSTGAATVPVATFFIAGVVGPVVCEIPASGRGGLLYDNQNSSATLIPITTSGVVEAFFSYIAT